MSESSWDWGDIMEIILRDKARRDAASDAREDARNMPAPKFEWRAPPDEFKIFNDLALGENEAKWGQREAFGDMFANQAFPGMATNFNNIGKWKPQSSYGKNAFTGGTDMNMRDFMGMATMDPNAMKGDWYKTPDRVKNAYKEHDAKYGPGGTGDPNKPPEGTTEWPQFGEPGGGMISGGDQGEYNRAYGPGAESGTGVGRRAQDINPSFGYHPSKPLSDRPVWQDANGDWHSGWQGASVGDLWNSITGSFGAESLEFAQQLGTEPGSIVEALQQNPSFGQQVMGMARSAWDWAKSNPDIVKGLGLGALTGNWLVGGITIIKAIMANKGGK